MSKKKRKNSNYHYATELSVTETAGLSKKTIIIIAAAAVLLVAVIVGIVGCTAAQNKPQEPQEPQEPLPLLYAEMQIAGFGSIIVELDQNEAPITVKNFVDLVEDGFYDGLTIFRAQEGFVIQGGQDETVDLKPIKGEFSSNGVSNNISHVRGVISMARTNNPNSATSQFFITLSDSAKYSLDGLYAGFGHVVEGMDVVDAIASSLLSKTPLNNMGFVADSDAIKITSIKMIDYKK